MSCSVHLQPLITNPNHIFCKSKFVGILWPSSSTSWSLVLKPKRGCLKGFALHALVAVFGGYRSKTHLLYGYFVCHGLIGFVGEFDVKGVMLDSGSN